VDTKGKILGVVESFLVGTTSNVAAALVVELASTLCNNL